MSWRARRLRSPTQRPSTLPPPRSHGIRLHTATVDTLRARPPLMRGPVRGTRRRAYDRRHRVIAPGFFYAPSAATVARCPTTLCIALKVCLPAALTAVLTSFVCRLTRPPQLHTFTCLSQDLQYCQSSCEDYCDRPDQTNGLSSTIISARWLRGEINRWSSSSLGWTSQTGAGASCLGTDGGNGRRQGVGVGVAGQGRQYSEGRGEGLVLTISNTLVVDAMHFLCLRYPCVTHLTRWMCTVHVGALYTIEKLRSNEGTVARLRQPDSTYRASHQSLSLSSDRQQPTSRRGSSQRQ